MKRIHIVGRKNSGKTTLIVELVQELTRRGYRIGTVKHTHHNHELDTPGKDSYCHRESGSSAVGILSPNMNAIFWPGERGHKRGSDKYEQFDALMADCDIVLVEGDSAAIAPKIEVFRAANTDQAMAKEDPSIAAVVTDDDLDFEFDTLPRNQIGAIADSIEKWLSCERAD